LNRLPHVGTAGWVIARAEAQRFPEKAGTWSAIPRCCAAPRSTRRSGALTGRGLPALVGGDAARFRFSVKLPAEITHRSRLQNVGATLDAFIAQASGLGDKLAVLLVQLPPSLAFDPAVAGPFFTELRSRHSAALVCEPRHPSWLSAEADALLASLQVGRVAADPAKAPASAFPAAGSVRGPMLTGRWSIAACTAHRGRTGRATRRPTSACGPIA
jgi:hypothetical protein